MGGILVGQAGLCDWRIEWYWCGDRQKVSRRRVCVRHRRVAPRRAGQTPPKALPVSGGSGGGAGRSR